MIREVKFESQERRIKQVIAALNENGIKDIEEANQICENAGVDPYQICEGTQGICFENAKWAYVCGAAITIKKGVKSAAEAAEAIGIGLQSFCIPGSVADDRKVVSATATWLPVCSARTHSASHSSQATSLSLPLRVLSRLLRWQTRFARTHCVASSTVWARTLP